MTSCNWCFGKISISSTSVSQYFFGAKKWRFIKDLQPFFFQEAPQLRIHTNTHTHTTHNQTPQFLLLLVFFVIVTPIMDEDVSLKKEGEISRDLLRFRVIGVCARSLVCVQSAACRWVTLMLITMEMEEYQTKTTLRRTCWLNVDWKQPIRAPPAKL